MGAVRRALLFIIIKLMPYTLGFIDDADLSEHFDKHVTQNGEFDCADESEYLDLADSFLGEDLNPITTSECRRMCADGSEGDKLRLNRVTGEFGCLTNDNHIRTYFIADPLVHRHPSNKAYFTHCCAEVLC
jgi:hypothetical protein